MLLHAIMILDISFNGKNVLPLVAESGDLHFLNFIQPF
jgi:hypothetical protein